jgi:hypothetical protein
MMLKSSNQKDLSTRRPIDGQEKLVRDVVHVLLRTVNLTKDLQVLAFSAGPRQCIGSRIALAEGAAIIANIVYSWEISLPSDTQMHLKKMEGSGISEYDRREWLCHWVPGFTRIPDRAKACMRRRVDKED